MMSCVAELLIDVAHGSVGEVWPTSPPTIQRDDQCRAEQLARDEALARQLQEDEGALYHATGDRPNFHGNPFFRRSFGGFDAW